MYAVAEPWPLEASLVSRDDHWLHRELDRIWNTFFQDVPRANIVHVSFARHWRARLGLITISEDERTTYIGINAFLRLQEVPLFVNAVTLAHELVHYAHGFGSPLPRKYRHPHRGGLIRKELTTRGLGREYRLHQEWIRDHWQDICLSRLHRYAACPSTAYASTIDLPQGR